MTRLHQLPGSILRRLKTLGRTDDEAAILRLFGLLHLPRRSPGGVTWRARELRYTDAPSLYYQLSEIYRDRVYDFSCHDPSPRILDVGANIGVATLRFRELFPESRLTAFEPDPAVATVLRTNLATFGDRKTEVVEAAAWKEDGSVLFNVTGDDSGGIAPSGSSRVRSVDLASYITSPVDFLKLDIEGAEFDVLRHLEKADCLGNVGRLFVEMHSWREGTPRFHEILSILARAGFEYRVVSSALFPSSPARPGFSRLPGSANLACVCAWR